MAESSPPLPRLHGAMFTIDKRAAISRTFALHFWEVILRPDVLFTLATVQGLTPYAFWIFGVGQAVPSERLTYIPALIAFIGWASFVSGCFLFRGKIKPAPQFVLAPKKRRIHTLIWVLIGISIIELILAVRVYGVLPIVSYIRGDNMIDVVTASSMQENSAVGQIALLGITVFTMGGLLLEAAIVAIEKQKKVPFVFFCGLVTAICVGMINGKRIVTVRLFVFLIAGLLLYSRNAVRNGLVVIPFARRPILAGLLMASIFAGLFSMFGMIAVIRNQGRVKVSSLEEFIIYQEGPILNMEQQTRSAGLGPANFALLPPLRQLIPIKWSFSSNAFDKDPPRFDQSSPSGFYELIQWYWGLPGIVIFPFIAGVFSKWLYFNSRKHVKYLLCYSQVTFSLMLVHSFNEFLIAPLVIAPCVVLWILGVFTNTKLSTRQSAFQKKIGVNEHL